MSNYLNYGTEYFCWDCGHEFSAINKDIVNPNQVCLFCNTQSVHTYINGTGLIVKCSTCGVINQKETAQLNKSTYEACPGCKRSNIEHFPGADLWYCYNCSIEFCSPAICQVKNNANALIVIKEPLDKKSIYQNI